VTKPSLFTQGDATRLCKGIHKAGLVVARVRVKPDGTLEADTATDIEIESNSADNNENEWDTVLIK
jgi:hypothetical protein